MLKDALPIAGKSVLMKRDQLLAVRRRGSRQRVPFPDPPMRQILLIAAIVMLLLLVLRTRQDGRHVVDPPEDDDWFRSQAVETETPVVVKFGATWCGPCNRMEPELDKFESRMGGRLRVVRVDIDKKPELADHYNVSSIPVTLILREGKVLDSATGAMAADQLAEWVRPHL